MKCVVTLVRATFYTLEGDPTFSPPLVEQDVKGRWRITVDSESIISVLLPKGRKPRREITHDTYDEIERVDATSGSSASSIPIPAQEVRQPQIYRLRFRNSLTNAIQLF